MLTACEANEHELLLAVCAEGEMPLLHGWLHHAQFVALSTSPLVSPWGCDSATEKGANTMPRIVSQAKQAAHVKRPLASSGAPQNITNTGILTLWSFPRAFVPVWSACQFPKRLFRHRLKRFFIDRSGR
jgi:hypothetical protein